MISGITWDCPTPTPAGSVSCRTVSIDTSIIKNYAAITITATAEDGSTVSSEEILFEIVCPDNVAII